MTPLPIEPHLNLAFALHAQPGSYAVLLGAGVSASAGIPAAWEVQEDLIAKLAAARGEQVPTGEDCASTWYKETYGREPGYDTLLADVASTSNARQALLRGYFEPDRAEREKGLKQPTPCHRAIAEMVESGHIRIVLTLNFDHLMEQALRERGIVPTVVSSEDDLVGMLPLHAHQALVWHLHGEYTSPSTMLNTPDELESYSESVSSGLGQLFDEYGLVIAGWSGKVDPALRAALARCSSHRFASYWCDPYKLSENASKTREQRRALFVQLTADTFFKDTAAAVSVLAVTGRQHPLSSAAQVAAAKRELASQGPAIDLHDVLRREATAVNALPQRVDGPWSSDNVEATRQHRLGIIEARCETLVALTATTVYWGGPQHDRWWLPSIELLAERPITNGIDTLIKLAAAPAVMVLYAAGVAAVASERWPLVGRLLAEPQTKDEQGVHLAAAKFLSPAGILGGRSASGSLYEYLKPVFIENLALGPDTYTQAWERFEYLRVVGQIEHRPAPDWPHLRATGQRDNYIPVPSTWLQGALSKEAGFLRQLEEVGFMNPELLVEAQLTYDQHFSNWATNVRWGRRGEPSPQPAEWYPDAL